MTKIIHSALIGLGNVNRNFLKLLEMKAERLRTQYGLEFRVVCVADSSGVAVNLAGFDVVELRQSKEQGRRVQQLPEFVAGQSPAAVLADLPRAGMPRKLLAIITNLLAVSQPSTSKVGSVSAIPRRCASLSASA